MPPRPGFAWVCPRAKRRNQLAREDTGISNVPKRAGREGIGCGRVRREYGKVCVGEGERRRGAVHAVSVIDRVHVPVLCQGLLRAAHAEACTSLGTVQSSEPLETVFT